MKRRTDPFFRLVNLAVRVYTHLVCRIDAPDLDKVPMQGPLIVIANHTGQIEVPLLFAHLQPRPITGWAKVETWDNWFLNLIFDLWGAIPIRRGEADMSALRKGLQALKEGFIFAVAPEGTRNMTGKLLRAHPGAVIIALHSGVPVLPIAHWGGENYFRNLKRFRQTDFHIRVGESFRLNTEGVKITAQVRQQIADEMMYRLAALMPEEYRGEYSNLAHATDKFIQKY
jgi:1-acyl-sn-glycerol-3-phosphate acyltransferase